MSVTDYPAWYSKQIEALELFHKLKQNILGTAAPRRCTDKPCQAVDNIDSEEDD